MKAGTETKIYNQGYMDGYDDAEKDKDILEMRLRFKIDQDEKISEEDNAEFATAMCNVVFYEDKVDEYLKKMEG